MSLFPRTLESDRLRYERVHPDDLDPLELYEHVRADAPHIDEVTRHVNWDPYPHPKQAEDWVARCGEEFEAGDAANYVIRPTDGEHADEFAGLAGIDPDWERRRATLGTWLRNPFWGRGYSGERAGRFLDLAIERLDLEVVAITHAVENEQSQPAIEKYVERHGGRREGRIRNDLVVDGDPRDVLRYSVAREEWADAR